MVVPVSNFTEPPRSTPDQSSARAVVWIRNNIKFVISGICALVGLVVLVFTRIYKHSQPLPKKEPRTPDEAVAASIRMFQNPNFDDAYYVRHKRDPSQSVINISSSSINDICQVFLLLQQRKLPLLNELTIFSIQQPDVGSDLALAKLLEVLPVNFKLNLELRDFNPAMTDILLAYMRRASEYTLKLTQPSLEFVQKLPKEARFGVAIDDSAPKVLEELLNFNEAQITLNSRVKFDATELSLRPNTTSDELRALTVLIRAGRLPNLTKLSLDISLGAQTYTEALHNAFAVIPEEVELTIQVRAFTPTITKVLCPIVNKRKVNLTVINPSMEFLQNLDAQTAFTATIDGLNYEKEVRELCRFPHLTGFKVHRIEVPSKTIYYQSPSEPELRYLKILLENNKFPELNSLNLVIDDTHGCFNYACTLSQALKLVPENVQLRIELRSFSFEAITALRPILNRESLSLTLINPSPSFLRVFPKDVRMRVEFDYPTAEELTEIVPFSNISLLTLGSERGGSYNRAHVPPFLTQLKCPISLIIRDFEPSELSSFNDFTSVTALILSRGRGAIDRNVLTGIINSHKVTRLDLRGITISDRALEDIVTLFPHLTRLSIEGLSGVSATGIEAFMTLPHLKRVDMGVANLPIAAQAAGLKLNQKMAALAASEEKDSV